MLMDCFQTDQHIALAYHTQLNDQSEHANRSLKAALSKLINDQTNDWDQSIHTCIRTSIKYMPFKVIYGHTAKLPIDFEVYQHE